MTNAHNPAASTHYTDARGVTHHPDSMTCPHCRAFNVGRRCGCTVAHTPVSVDDIDLDMGEDLYF